MTDQTRQRLDAHHGGEQFHDVMVRSFVMDWVRVPLPQYLAQWDDDPFAPDVSPEARADRLDHFMEHCKLGRDDLTWLVERCGFTIETTRDRSHGQFLWLVARP